MMHKAWSSIEEVPYCFSRSYVKFQGHTALKIVDFDPKWAFPDCNSSLNSPMAMKCCTKLETAKERCPIVFQGHQSNFKVTRYKASPILTQIGHFRTIGQSQLSNPSDLPCFSYITKTIAFRLKRDALSNQWWNIVKWTLRNTIQWNFNRNSYIFIQENVFENVVCKCRLFRLHGSHPSQHGFGNDIHHTINLRNFCGN